MRVVNPSMAQTPMQQQTPTASVGSFGGMYNPSTDQTLNLIPGVNIPYGLGMGAPDQVGTKPTISQYPPKSVLGNPKGGIPVRGGGGNDAISGGVGGTRNPPSLGQPPYPYGQTNSSGLQVPPSTEAAYKEGGVVKASHKRKGGTVKSDKPVVRGRGCATKGHGKMRMY